MTQAVTVYRWDDEGAPQLDLNNGSMLQVLKKCLIDGYGTKQGAGWTLNEISADNNNMIFSPASQSWYYLLYDDARNVKLGSKGAMLGAIEGWTNIEDTVSTFEYGGWSSHLEEDIYSNQCLDKRGATWCIIATTETCYILQSGVGGGAFKMVSILGRIDSDSFDMSYVCIAGNPKWDDYDIIQLFSNHSSKSSYLARKTKFALLKDVNTGLPNYVMEMFPTNQYKKFTSNQSLDWNVWGDAVFSNGSQQIVGKLPFLEVPYITSASFSIPDFTINGNFLYFNKLRWLIS